MAGHGVPTIDGVPQAGGLRVAVVAAQWHDTVMAGLIAGADRALTESGAESNLFRVPGSFELPVAALHAARSGYDAVVALGVVIRGDTPHFEYVCQAATEGLLRVSLDTGIPIGFGVLTCDNDPQALDRAGLPDSREDKGYEATHAALSTALTIRAIG